MNAHGWVGKHSIDAEAHGNGPATFVDAMTQEFQWARSLAMILLTLTPLHIHRLAWRSKFQFLFGQLWYFLFSSVMLAAFVLPPLALVLGRSFAHVLYLEFLFIAIWPSIIALIVVHWLKRQGLLRPANAKVLGWEGICFELARWPWVVWALIDAFRVTISKSHLTWRITPKAAKSRTAVPIRFLIPYLLIIFFCVVAAVVHEPNPATRGYFWFTLFNAVCYVVLLTVILYFNARESRQALAAS